MKQITMKCLVWIALCATLFSFSKIGGHSYTIRLNEKLILQHYLTSKAPTPSFSLGQITSSDQLYVDYNECGQIGKERKLSIRDERDNLLKEWKFADATDEHTPMACKAIDILALKKSNNNLRLFYTSREVSQGRLLAIIEMEDIKAKK